MPPYSDWLDEHLETFVRPKLGSIPNLKAAKNDKGGPLVSWTPRHLVALHAVWKRAKQVVGDRTMLLPGRDVWLLEVLARMEGYPSQFEPVISSTVSRSGLLPDYSKHHCIDTGYSGSVPKNLKCQHWHLVSWRTHGNPLADQQPPSYGLFEKPMSVQERQKLFIAHSKQLSEHMLFPVVQSVAYLGQPSMPPPPNRQGILYIKPKPNPIYQKQLLIALPGLMEGCSKYWLPGEVEMDNRIGKPKAIRPQIVAEPAEFKRAALLTMLIAESCKKER